MSALHVEPRGHTVWVRLSRPEARNALGPEFWDRFAETLTQAAAPREVRAVVLSGDGPSFCAGLDLVAMAPKLPLDGAGKPDGARTAAFHRLIRDMQETIRAPVACRVPVIAAMWGHCLGGGLDLACACDLRLAAAGTVFGVRETKMAMVADLGVLHRLPALVGPTLARELVFTGRDFDASFALEAGLINRVLPDADTTLQAAFELADEIAANSPLAVTGAKLVMNRDERAREEAALAYVAAYNAGHLLSQDLGVALAAFVSGQRPDFEGR